MIKRMNDKISVKELQGVPETIEKIKKFLQENSDYAYSRVQIAKEVFGSVDFYPEVTYALKKLEEKGLVKSKKRGLKYYYWWKK